MPEKSGDVNQAAARAFAAANRGGKVPTGAWVLAACIGLSLPRFDSDISVLRVALPGRGLT